MRSWASRWLHILNASLNQKYRQIVYTSTLHQPNYHLINPDGNFLFKGNLLLLGLELIEQIMLFPLHSLHNDKMWINNRTAHNYTRTYFTYL